MSVIIRRAESRDVHSIFTMNEIFNEPGCTTVQQMAEELGINDHEIVLVAELDRFLVGFCCGQIVRSICYSAPHGKITELFVREECRNKGVGKQLLVQMESCLHELGVNDFLIYTNPNNLKAQSLYKTCGYAYDAEFAFKKYKK